MFEISGQGKPLISRNVGKIKSEHNKKKVNTTRSLPNISPKKALSNASKLTDKKTTKRKVVVKTPAIKINPSPPKKQLSIAEEAEHLLAQEHNPSLNGTGLIKVRFNHYNKTFPIHNGVLRWANVDEEYCISFVFRGNYTRDLREELSGEGRDIKVSEINCRRDENGIYFLGLKANSSSDSNSTSSSSTMEAEPVTYALWLVEDPVAGVGAEGLRLRDGPLVATDHNHNSNQATLQSGNNAVNDITNSLLNMKTSELHSQEANDLRERRDLEDILYS